MRDVDESCELEAAVVVHRWHVGRFSKRSKSQFLSPRSPKQNYSSFQRHRLGQAVHLKASLYWLADFEKGVFQGHFFVKAM